jgi:hypothetical protein
MKFVAFNIIGIIIGLWATVLVCMFKQDPRTTTGSKRGKK